MNIQRPSVAIPQSTQREGSENQMHAWDGIIPEEDLDAYRRAGWGHPVGFGQKPALLIVDVTYNFCGTRPAPLIDAIHESNRSCGASAWDAVDVIKNLKETFEARALPVIYTTGIGSDASPVEQGRWVDKNPLMKKAAAFEATEGVMGNEVVAAIAPGPKSIVIPKLRPSAFFGTALAGHLQYLGVDTIIVTGTTTSGCVRATVLDAFSLNYRVIVPEDATFDRGSVSHAVNLFDMHQKYADVMSSRDVTSAVESL